ncbi:hypothetical protein M9H77_09404 [Catharanthus roseus]|uniref:Uncharacterized protein n=1 Tax=Catharanthus roseus TaxID=4058 RepID=A0ACC0C0I7_CATRO|nr:hypothetical protein M9H77_09404 [Catharanthus roseus]
MRQFARAQMVPEACDSHLDLHLIQLRGNDHTYWRTQHAIHLDARYQWQLRVRDAPTIAAETLSYPSDEYIRCLPEVDDMASVVIQESPSSPSQMALFAKKVQMIIPRCMGSIGGTSGFTPSQHDIQQTFPHVLDRGARGVKRGARRHPGREAGGRCPPVPPAPERPEHVDPDHAVVERGERSSSDQPFRDPFDSPNLDMPSFCLGLTPASQSLPSGSGTPQMPPAPGLGFASFQSPHFAPYGFFRFRAHPPPGTVGSSMSNQPISQASSSGEEEREDDIDGVQHLASGIVLVRRLCGSHHPTGLSCSYYFLVLFASYR